METLSLSVELSILAQQLDPRHAADVLSAVDQSPGLLHARGMFSDRTLLHEACWVGNQYLAAGLLARGGAREQLSAKSSNGRDALVYACTSGNARLVTLLIDHGADATRLDALSEAALRDQQDCCEVLLSRGADPHAPLEDGSSALDIYAQLASPQLSPEEVRVKKTALLAIFATGPHPTQVQRRIDETWNRRWPFLMVLVGHRYLPSKVHRAVLADSALPPWACIPPIKEASRLDLLRSAVFSQLGLVFIITSFI